MARPILHRANRGARRGGAWKALAALAGLAAGATAQAPPHRFIGPASCDASSCHGSSRPQKGRVAQDEYATWFLHDRHRRAWEVLSGALAQQMGTRLGLDVRVAPECVACHAAPALSSAAGPEQGSGADGRANQLLLEFGVSCEACHGPASGWYGNHFQRGWDYSAACATGGMNDLKDPVKLAETCLGCHLGDATRSVDHRLIAAGHPDLAFEAGTFLLGMAPHWRQRGAESRAWLARSVVVTQAVALREQMKAVARHAEPAVEWPEFADLDCASCHHDLGGAGWDALRDWRLARGLPVPVGRPRFDGSRAIGAGAVAAAIDPELSIALVAAVEKVETLMAEPGAQREAVRAAAQAAAELADRAARSLGAQRDPGQLVELSQGVAARLGRDAELVAAQGYKGAVQCAQLLWSLRVEFEEARWTPRTDGASAAIDAGLLAPLSTPESFRPHEFARAFAEIASRR